MDLSKFLTIVIPCKNEGKIIEQTLSLLNFQKGIQDVRVIVCDSSDDVYTSHSLESRRTDYFNLRIISGGLPSVARNKGAEHVETPYVLFLDADIFLLDNNILNHCVWDFLVHDSDLITCKVRSTTGEYNAIFRMFDTIQKIFKPITPFCLGGFMMVKMSVYNSIGGFDENARVAEDYLFSKQVRPSKFFIMNTTVFTTPRRFESKGVWYMLKLMVSSFFNRNNKTHFENDKGYWE
jgi:glycosyltransferase involved in cell wall biosynthesis